MPSLVQRLRAVEAALEGPARYQDIRLDLTDPSGRPILTAGGRWDKTFGRFLDPLEHDAEHAAVIKLQESQVEFATWFAEWLCDFREGRRAGVVRETQLALMAGDRRGGKTFVADAAVLAALVDVPLAPSLNTPLIAWIVSRSFRERFELEQWILDRVPRSWYRHRQAPEHEFCFVHGPTLRLLSADDPDALKQGRVDIAFINEPQKLQARAVANVILGASDLGGLVILAANPPRGATNAGAWLHDLKDAIETERADLADGKAIDPLGVKFFNVESRKNKAIDQIARRRAGRIAALIDPTLRAGDVEGQWLRDDCLAYRFDKRRNLGPVPREGDITAEVVKRKIGRPFPAFAGVDFQARPWNAGVVLRAFGDPAHPTYYAVREFLREGWEDDFLDDVFAAKYEPESLIWIGDASGTWQDARHGKGRVSFDVFKARRWRIEPPQRKRSDRGEHPRNPDVSDRLNRVNMLLATGRLIVDPALCPKLAEAFERCALAPNGHPRGNHAHITDAAGYALWWVEPEPKATRSIIGAAWSVNEARPKVEY